MDKLTEEQKWDGFSVPTSDYIHFLFDTLQYYKEITDVRQEIHATIGCTCDFLEILFYEGINSVLKFENSSNVKNFFRLIRMRSEPELEDTLDWERVAKEKEDLKIIKPPPGLEDFVSISSKPDASVAPPCAHDFSVRDKTLMGPHGAKMIEQISFLLENCYCSLLSRICFIINI